MKLMPAKVCWIRRPSYYVYKDMIEDIFPVLMSYPVLITSDISQLRLIMISQEINSLAYNKEYYDESIDNILPEVSVWVTNYYLSV